MARVAMCKCGEPLVATFLYRGKEFLCICCGCTYEFFGPTPAEETPELLARLEQIEAEWNLHAGDFLVPGGWRQDCPLCGSDDPHISHATDEERAADKTAREWLLQRTGKSTRGR